MITVNKLNGNEFVINCEQIEKIENHPDTTITMMNGHVYIVKQSIEDIQRLVIEYKRSFFNVPAKRGE
ncbi:flagellar FlbD family protein [Geotoga petraea]|jgi:flagellar protein FlbD|uniref:Flagellar protein FlbD n=1 Tax=Geotoga petraea TaxID=28234 RepID=A0A1G6IMX7_9BACT|nr:flagellar FlbD family protein [Geotoga petraea]MDK2945308.1 flagellar protein FlbD [Geotoga sp.]TGG89253.1 flagellar protein FlbD [Geotoga petraea]SDC07912.1 flagellar protein FlbD [Geotoga petraea]